MAKARKRIRLVSQRMQRERSANSQQLFAEHSSCVHISHANELSANAWQMFSEWMATTNVVLCPNTRRTFGLLQNDQIFRGTVKNYQVLQQMLGGQYKMTKKTDKKLHSANAWRLFVQGNLFSEKSPQIRQNFQWLLRFAMYSRIIRHTFA